MKTNSFNQLVKSNLLNLRFNKTFKSILLSLIIVSVSSFKLCASDLNLPDTKVG